MHEEAGESTTPRITPLESGRPEPEETMTSNQFQDKERISGGRTEHCIKHTTDRAAKQIIMRSAKAEPAGDTSRMIKTRLPEDTLGDEQWTDMRKEGNAE